MLDSKFFDNIAKQLANAIPPQFDELKKNLESNFKAILQSIFSKLDLVTQDEFETQVKLLEKANKKILHLEDKLHQLEKQLRPDDDSG